MGSLKILGPGTVGAVDRRQSTALLGSELRAGGWCLGMRTGWKLTRSQAAVVEALHNMILNHYHHHIQFLFSPPPASHRRTRDPPLLLSLFGWWGTPQASRPWRPPLWPGIIPRPPLSVNSTKTCSFSSCCYAWQFSSWSGLIICT